MHKLQKQILDVKYYEETGTDQFYDKALHLFYQDLQPEMELILNKYSGSDQLININDLTINLGVTYESELRQQWISRFKEEFETELVRKINQIKNGLGSSGESIKSIIANELDTLMFFLVNGALPWSSSATGINIHALFDKLLIRQPTEINRRLRRENSSDSMIKRLVLQFSDKQIENLIKVLEPSESSFIILTAVELKKSQQRDRIVNSGNREFRDAVWEFILTYILTDRGSYFNTREFIGSLLHRIAAHFNVGFGWLIQEIYKSIYRLPFEPVQFRLGTILQEIYLTDQPAKSKAIDHDIRHEQIVDFLLSGKMGRRGSKNISVDYKALLIDWMQNSPLELREFLQKEGQIKLLRRVTEILSEKEIHQLIRILIPAEAPFVIDFSKEVTKQQEEQNWVQVGKSQFRKDMWLVLLNIILNDRGSFFNQKMFVLATLEKLSLHYNLDVSFFIDRLFTLIEDQQILHTTSHIFQLLFTIRKELILKMGKKALSEKARLKLYYKHLTHLISSNFESKWNAPQTVHLSKTEIIGYLIDKDASGLKDWITSNLISGKQLEKFLQDFDLATTKALLKEIKNEKGEAAELIKQTLHREFSPDPAIQKSIAKQKLTEEESIIEAQKMAAFRDKGDRLWKSEVSEIKSADEMGKWLERKIKTLQTSDSKRLKQVLSIYFDKITQKQWTVSELPEELISELMSRISSFDQPFLTGYISDFRLLIKQIETVLPGITAVWIASKILVYWSSGKTLSQLYLSEYLFLELSVKFGKSITDIKSILFGKALQIQSRLSSTLILDLGKEDSAKPEILSNVLKEGTKEKEIPLIHEDVSDEIELDDSDTIYIANAGLVLLSPFFPVLFEKAGLISKRAFKSEDEKYRGVHLLQYLVKHEEKSPEHLLTLPKILCGLELDKPVIKEISLSKKEKEIANSLLTNVISQWKALGNTTIDGLQQTFLLRNGGLHIEVDRWELQVEARSFDMLIDRIPWSFKLIKYPWMKKALYTIWR